MSQKVRHVGMAPLEIWHDFQAISYLSESGVLQIGSQYRALGKSMPSEFKAFIASICVMLLMMWILGRNSWEIADSPISVILLLIMFGLTYAWVKNEIFPDDK
ncbi:MAG TPA: hypothetical protein VGK47_00620 [Nitrososphaeraceae archaeon]